MKNKFLLALLFALCLSSFAFAFRAQTRPAIQWEYKFENGASEKRANELGADGWELVTVLPGVGGRAVPEYMFKRAK